MAETWPNEKANQCRECGSRHLASASLVPPVWRCVDCGAQMTEAVVSSAIWQWATQIDYLVPGGILALMAGGGWLLGLYDFEVVAWFTAVPLIAAVVSWKMKWRPGYWR